MTKRPAAFPPCLRVRLSEAPCGLLAPVLTGAVVRYAHDAAGPILDRVFVALDEPATFAHDGCPPVPMRQVCVQLSELIVEGRE